MFATNPIKIFDLFFFFLFIVVFVVHFISYWPDTHTQNKRISLFHWKVFHKYLSEVSIRSINLFTKQIDNYFIFNHLIHLIETKALAHKSYSLICNRMFAIKRSFCLNMRVIAFDLTHIFFFFCSSNNIRNGNNKKKQIKATTISNRVNEHKVINRAVIKCRFFFSSNHFFLLIRLFECFWKFNLLTRSSSIYSKYQTLIQKKNVFCFFFEKAKIYWKNHEYKIIHEHAHSSFEGKCSIAFLN